MMIPRSFRKLSQDPRFVIAGAILVIVGFIAIAAPWIAPFGPEEMDISKRLASPNHRHWLGCDLNGADVLTSLLYGAQVSLYVGFLTVFLSVTLGTVLGAISGYFGGWTDVVLMRIVDILLAFPGILLAMVLATVLGPSIHNVVLAISATGWISAARLVRGQVLSIREREFVVANRALGGSIPRTLFFHVLPSVIPHLIVHSSFSLSGVILVESSLSFLGLGPQGGTPTWGALLSQGQTVLTEAPFLAVSPGIAIMVIVLSLNFLGDSLRDALDPKFVS